METAFEKHIDRASTGYHAEMYDALKAGAVDEYYDSMVVDDEEVQRGVDAGRLVVDTRLRDALRHVGGRRDAARVSDADARRRGDLRRRSRRLGEADVVRLQRRLDTLEHRLASVEQRLPRRVYRKLAAPAKRILRRG